MSTEEKQDINEKKDDSYGDELVDAIWPDNPPSCTKDGCFINDVSRLSDTKVQRVFFPRNKTDIINIVNEARSRNIKICICGTKHSMGGQTLTNNGYQIDMKYMKKMKYNAENNTIKCDTGCLWSDLIKYLNKFGKSPRTMQSYSSFAVGGTISVNAHGITTDYCLIESIISLEIINGNGKLLNVSRNENKELFGLLIGGYGLFGIIINVTMKVNDNIQLLMDSFQSNIEDFPLIYEKLNQETNTNKEINNVGGIEIKLCRLNIISMDKITLYIFRRSYAHNTISKLDIKPREFNWKTRFVYVFHCSCQY